MKTSEIFALIVRVVGLLCLIYLLRNLTNQWVDGTFPKDVAYYITRVLYLAVGVYFVRGAPRLVTFAYGDGAKGGGDKPSP